ncbi:hypothetical protein BDN71DRAFT_1501811 [Pleurotus eryngii]|uniref:F-box domain-containing protein n=1 Tax=Pleurotus eryngii TaxID=5323 RepID=A0A9P6A621_PLEER|nr:hypothetical protein BDN71DRAFT_1501811 [Pleurotus eryngii]
MGANSHHDSPIFKLQLELLGEIFVLAKSSTLRSRDNGTLKSEGGCGWLNVVGVCRTWQEIALNTAQIWNRFDMPDIKHVEWALLLLARSKDVPLFVECASPCKNTNVLCAIGPHLPRIQELYLPARSSQILSFFVAKGLRFLGLRPLDNASSPVIEGVLKIDTPILSCLELVRVDLPASIPCLPLLRRLYIGSMEGFCDMTVKSLLLFLRSTPSLESLEIIHALRKPTALSYPTVDLPKLSRISLTSKYFQTSLLFQHIRYPSSSAVGFISTDPPKASLNSLDSSLTLQAVTQLRRSTD